MKTEQLPAVNWCELYGQLAEAVDHAGFTIKKQGACMDLVQKPRERQLSDAAPSLYQALRRLVEQYELDASLDESALSQARRALAQTL